MNLKIKNRRFGSDCTPLCLAMYMDVHKEGTGHLSPFFGGEERVNKLQRYLTNFLLGQHHPIGICECLDARVLFIFLRS